MAKRGGFPGGGMPGNMANLMKQAQKMQRQMEEATKDLIVAAVNEAFEKVDEASSSSMSKLTGGMGGSIPGLF